MIKDVIMYTVICDNCGKDHGENNEIRAWGHESSAIDEAINDDWIEYDGNHYCPECVTVTTDDEIIINSERTKTIEQ